MFKKSIEGQIHMNILLIGNGFDLAHGLPTKYTDFLEWIIEYRKFYTYSTQKGTVEYKETDKPILKYFNKLFSDCMNKDVCDEIYRLIHDNIWIEYFQQCSMPGKEKWIDFESEISEVIQSLDKNMHNQGVENAIESIINNYHMECHFKRGIKYSIAIQTIIGNLPEEVTFKEIRNRFLDDLKKLIRVFEIYLTDYVEKISVKVISPDIDKIATIHYEEHGEKGTIFSKVLSDVVS